MFADLDDDDFIDPYDFPDELTADGYVAVRRFKYQGGQDCDIYLAQLPGNLLKRPRPDLDLSLVVVKVYRGSVAPDDWKLQAIQDEILTLKNIDHNQVPAYLADRHIDGRPILVQELVRGPNLHRQLKRAGTFPAAQWVQFARDLILATAAVHDHGYFHMDIKPENIVLIKRSHSLKVVDFGLAGHIGSRRREPRPTRGTLSFMAPEAVDGYRGRESDVYSLCLTLVFSATCINVIDPREDVEAHAAAMIAENPDNFLGMSEEDALNWARVQVVKSRRPDLTLVPQWMLPAVERGLSFDRSDRFQDARELLAHFNSIFDPDARTSRVTDSSGTHKLPDGWIEYLDPPLPPPTPDFVAPRSFRETLHKTFLYWGYDLNHGLPGAKLRMVYSGILFGLLAALIGFILVLSISLSLE